MKRKRDTFVEIKTAKVQTSKAKTSECLNLNTVCTITQSGELNSPFCLQTTDEFVILRTKHEAEVMKLERNLGNYQSKIQLSSTKYVCSKYNVAESLTVNEKRIFQTSNHQDKNDIMLSNTLFPRCVQKHVQVLKTSMSPYKNDRTVVPILASLSNHGSIELSTYVYDQSTYETSLHTIAELCENRKKSFALTTYMSLGKLKEIFNELTFSSFDWCPKVIDNLRFLVALTKSNEIVFFMINSLNEVFTQHCQKQEHHVSELKWVISHNNHILLVADSRGFLTRYHIEVPENGIITSLEKVDETGGELKVPVSFIYAESYTEGLIVLCIKAHSVEVFLFNKLGERSLTKHIGISITGITSASNSKPAFLLTTLSHKIFYLELTLRNNDLKIEKYQQVDYEPNPDLNPAKFGAYGIASSKNKVLIFVSLFPRISYDHLVLKQPTCLSINCFAQNNPYELLKNNKSLLLTDFYDCVEAVRFMGCMKAETLLDLENIDCEAALTNEFLYFLKLNLIVNYSKMANYETKSDAFCEDKRQTVEANQKLIEMVSDCFLLQKIVKREKKSLDCQRALRAIMNFLQSTVTAEFTKEPFKTYQQTLKQELENIMVNCRPPVKLKPEVCSYCDAEIAIDKLNCNQSHPISRCVITKLQIPIDVNNFCPTCHSSVIDLETLKEVTGVSDHLCPYCDRKLMFT